MKISINYIKKYLDFELPPIDVLVDRIGVQLGALEEGAEDLWEVYNQVIVAKVVECNKIEGSDHLSLCLIDDNKKHTDDSIRNDQGLIQVVCGANNVAKDLMVAWLPPKSIIPSTFNKDQIILESKELKGQISHGMLASGKELGIDDDHSGILIVDVVSNPGDSFAKLYELDDYVIDIENKMFTHRPDCFGLLGIAREVSGILNKPFKSPDWYLNIPQITPDNTDLPFKVTNEIPSLVPRFSALSMAKLEVKSSPILIKSYLSRMGIRPINSIVDATNLCMLETGQPLHAYDYDKLKEISGSNDINITVRNPKVNESLELINDKEVKPEGESIIIACEKPIGLGGIMGSKNSAISENSQNIIIEAANFDMYSIRKTAMKFGVFSDAVTRFTKGQSPLQTTRVLKRASELIKQLCGEDAIIAYQLVDNNNLPEATIKRDSLNPEIKVESSFVSSRLGLEIPTEHMADLLRNVECQADASESELTINSPYWRTDLEIREDVVEEIGRLFGYDKIELKPLTRSIIPTDTNIDLARKSQIRQVLSSAGANEALTYSFISSKIIKNSNQDLNIAFKLANSQSPDVEYYRLSLLPSLLIKVNANIRAGYKSFALFELGKSYKLLDQLPKETNSLALLFTSSEKTSESSYYQARAYLDYLLKKLNINGFSYKAIGDSSISIPQDIAIMSRPFDSNRCAAIINKVGSVVGFIGEFLPGVSKSFKLPISTAGFEIDLNSLKGSSNTTYRKLSKFPSIKQDITLKAANSIKFSELINFLGVQLNKSLGTKGYGEIELRSIFHPENDTSRYNYAFRITITDYTTTLKDNEVNVLLDDLAEAAKEKLNTERVIK